jgi:hypothetical protein
MRAACLALVLVSSLCSGPFACSAERQPPSAAGHGAQTTRVEARQAAPPSPALDAASQSDATSAPDAGSGARAAEHGTAAVRIAFIGDQGIGPDAAAVLELIAREHAQALIHAGDLAYDTEIPGAWNAQVDAILGPDFPYFAAIGNHDVDYWSGPDGFAATLAARLARIPDAHCTGDLGVASTCKFHGIGFVLSGVGTYGSDHEAYLDAALSGMTTAFRLCIWHKNQHDMQVGAKTDEVGWPAYQICAAHGAAIITGHEHSYARTRTLAAIGNRTEGHGAIGLPNQIDLTPGRTAVIVTGLAGRSQRPFTQDHTQDTWWSTIYAQNYQLKNDELTSTNETIQYGALFIDFDTNTQKAHAYFKTTDNQIQDDFFLTMQP